MFRTAKHINRYIPTTSSPCRVCNGTQPPHISVLHFRNVVYARSLSERCAARHDMVHVACGRAAHTVLGLPVAPQMFRCRCGSLSRAHSVGCPPCTPRQHVTLGSRSFGWMLYLFRLLSVCSHCSCHFAIRSSAGLHRRGWEVEMKLFRECRRLFNVWW